MEDVNEIIEELASNKKSGQRRARKWLHSALEDQAEYLIDIDRLIRAYAESLDPA